MAHWDNKDHVDDITGLEKYSNRRPGQQSSIVPPVPPNMHSITYSKYTFESALVKKVTEQIEQQ